MDRVGRSGGLVIFSRHNVKCEVTSFSHNHISVNFLNNGAVVWSLSCYYGFPERRHRKDSWELIRKLDSKTRLP